MRALVLFMLLLASAARAQDYADDGAITVTTSTGSVMVQGVSFTYDLYTPMTGGPWPIIALGHGFSNSKTAMQGVARALASRGNFVVVPQFPLLDSNHARNGQAMLAAIDAVAQAQPSRVDASRQAVAGHSAGGLSAMLAALSRTSLKAVVELDGVDGNTALTAAQLAAARAPTLLLFAEPAMCNMQNNSSAWYAQLPAPKARFKVATALHCDPTEPADPICTLGCPGTDAQRTRRFKRAAVAWLQYFVSCDLAARTSIDGAEFQASKTAGALSSEQFDGIPAAPCGGAGGGSAGGAAGGSTAGGSTAGGSAAGGSAAGGSTAGGSTAGGSAAGGSTAGGSTAGGSTAGGSAAGGSAAGGSAGGSAGGVASPGGCGCAGTAVPPELLLVIASLLRRRWSR